MPKTFIDLFAGIGGFHWALEDMGYTCRLAVEKDTAAQDIYKYNFPEKTVRSKPSEYIKNKLIGDIRSLTRSDPDEETTEREVNEIETLLREDYGIKKGDISIICGGFPCQPFSKSGEQKGDKDITRGTLFRDILLLVEAIEPDYLFLENVRNLAGPKHKETLNTIIQRIRLLKYVVEDDPIILSPHQLSQDDGSPQIRERAFILAHRKGVNAADSLKNISLQINKIKKSNKTKWDAKNILIENKNVKKKYFVGKQEQLWLKSWDQFLNITQKHKLPGFPIWTEDFDDKKSKISGEPEWKQKFRKQNREFYLKLCKCPKLREKIRIWLQKIRKFPASRRKFEWQASSAFKDGEKRSLQKLLIQLRPSGIRVKPPTHYPALVAITQTTIVGPKLQKGGNSNQFRYITPSEAARLQGMTKIKFKNQSDALCYKQLGNAVNIKVIKYLAERLMGKSDGS